MSQLFDCLCHTLDSMNDKEVELSIFSGVGGCLCSSFSKIYLSSTPSCVLMKTLAVSASATDATTGLSDLHIMSNGPLRGGLGTVWESDVLFDK